MSSAQALSIEYGLAGPLLVSICLFMTSEQCTRRQFRREAMLFLHGQSDLMEPGELVPVSALEDNLSLLYAKESASAKAEGFPGRLECSAARPFQNGPFAVLEQVLHFRKAVRDI